MSKPKVCLWGSRSPYSWDFVKEFKDEFDIYSVVIEYSNSEFKYKYSKKIKNPIKFKPFSTLFNLLFIVPYLTYLIIKYDKKYDCHVIHYLSDIIAIAMILANPKKPIVYFTYGSDYRYPKLKRIFKNMLERIDLIMSGSIIVANELIRYYNVNFSKIDTTLTFKVDKVFTKLPLSCKNKIREKLKLSNEDIVIFSPRAIKSFYNHHLLLSAINLINKNISKKIKIIFIKYGDKKYYEKLFKDFSYLKKYCIVIDNILTPKEMAEIYNISDITVSLPLNDGIGKSNVEAILCGSIVLLNEEIKNYKILFRNGKYCKYTKPTPESIAKSIENIIIDLESFKVEQERIRILRFIDWEKNKKQIINKIKKVIEMGGI